MSRIDLAYTLHTRGDLAAAEDIYRSMIHDGEEPRSAANNLFALLHGQGRSSDLIDLYRLIEPMVSDHGDWAFGLARFLLLRGEFEPGWTWYEARRHTSHNRVDVPKLSFPEWDGGPVKRVLVLREQGRGDEIQFARYISALAQRDIDVLYLCRPELARLFQHLPAKVIGTSDRLGVGEFDAWCFVGSLPRLLGPPFDIPPPIEVRAVARSRGKIGVMAAGAPTHANDHNRSLPHEAATRLISTPGAISLRPEDTGARDFQDTAEIIAGLDLVITVDTSVAHLAGSMRKPVWVLLPARGVDWRWRLQRADSPWYPSARLFRMQPDSDWRQVVTEVLAALP